MAVQSIAGLRRGMHLPVNVKFWLYIVRGATESDCWGWEGFTDKDGYGKLRCRKNCKGAHIISYEIHFGAVPEGVMVLHTCNNPPCSNPAHLYTGNHQKNMDDRMAAGHYPANERAPHAKFPDAVADAVRSAAGTHSAIATEFGMSRSQVSNIKAGRQRPSQW